MSDTRDAYVQKMKAELDKWSARIGKLEAEAKQNQAVVQEQIEALKKKRQTSEANLEKVRQAGEDAWEDLKVGFESALSSLGDAIRTAHNRFK